MAAWCKHFHFYCFCSYWILNIHWIYWFSFYCLWEITLSVIVLDRVHITFYKILPNKQCTVGANFLTFQSEVYIALINFFDNPWMCNFLSACIFFFTNKYSYLVIWATWIIHYPTIYRVKLKHLCIYLRQTLWFVGFISSELTCFASNKEFLKTDHTITH